jgi:hypothetical protein
MTTETKVTTSDLLRAAAGIFDELDSLGTHGVSVNAHFNEIRVQFFSDYEQNKLDVDYLAAIVLGIDPAVEHVADGNAHYDAEGRSGGINWRVVTCVQVTP